MNKILNGFKMTTDELLTELLSFKNSNNLELRKWTQSSEGRIFMARLLTIKTISSGVSARDSIEKFIREISKVEPGQNKSIRELIETRDEDYFLKTQHMLGLSDEGMVKNLVRKVWTCFLNNNDKDCIWSYLDAYLDIANNYIKMNPTK